jgi:hypothetical protein
MKIYSKDRWWEGATVFIAKDRIDAAKILKKIRVANGNRDEKFKCVREKTCYVSVQTIKSVEPIPNTRLKICTFVNKNDQVVTSDDYEIGQKVAFFPLNIIYSGKRIKLRKFQQVCSYGLIEPINTKLTDGTDISEVYDVKPHDKFTNHDVPFSDLEYLDEWVEQDVEPGLIIEFCGDS